MSQSLACSPNCNAGPFLRDFALTRHRNACPAFKEHQVQRASQRRKAAEQRGPSRPGKRRRTAQMPENVSGSSSLPVGAAVSFQSDERDEPARFLVSKPEELAIFHSH